MITQYMFRCIMHSPVVRTSDSSINPVSINKIVYACVSFRGREFIVSSVFTGDSGWKKVKNYRI